jgi:hypothetical protein
MMARGSCLGFMHAMDAFGGISIHFIVPSDRGQSDRVARTGLALFPLSADL